MHAFNKGELRYYDLFHTDKDYEAEAKALPLKGKTVLEIGSGTGLMTKELRKLGYRVTTVDPNIEADYNSVFDIPEKRFDNITALYDVWNYLTFEERMYIGESIIKGTQRIIEEWDKSQGVKLFTHKMVKNCHRVRLGFRFFNNAHLLFIYWGLGKPAIAYHKLYL